MKSFVVAKMLFIFLYFVLTVFYIISEIRDPCWVSYIRGIGTASFTLVLIKDIVEVVRKKSDET